MGFPGDANGKEPACQFRRHKRCKFDLWMGKIPWRRKWLPTPAFLPEKSHGQRNLAGYSLYDRKELDTTEATQHAGRVYFPHFTERVSDFPGLYSLRRWNVNVSLTPQSGLFSALLQEVLEGKRALARKAWEQDSP